ncbi:MAG: hypothetical protein ACOX47_00775 [Bacillota bacterium]|jgi:hypothetical protein
MVGRLSDGSIDVCIKAVLKLGESEEGIKLIKTLHQLLALVVRSRKGRHEKLLAEAKKNNPSFT